MQVTHVAIGQVGHKAAVGEAAPEEVHGCGEVTCFCSDGSARGKDAGRGSGQD